MEYRYDGDALAVELLNDVHNPVLVAYVQVGGRLVKDEEFRLLDYGLGQEYKLFLAVREFVDFAVPVAFYVETEDSVFHYLPVFFGGLSVPAGVGESAHVDEFFDGVGEVYLNVGGQEGDFPGVFPGINAVDVSVLDGYAAG